MAFQPFFRDKFNITNKPDEFSDNLAGSLSSDAEFQLFKYPENIENELSNVVLLSFNVIEDAATTQARVGGLPVSDAYLRLQGNSITSEVPWKNTTTQGFAQQDTVQAGADLLHTYIPLGLDGVIRKYKRTNVCALMPMPQSIKYMSQAGWQDVNEGGAVGQLAAIALSSEDRAAKQAALKNAVTTATVQAVSDTAIGNGVGGALTKSVKNTFQDQTFIGMQRRQFQFTWLVAPKTPGELQKLANIITLMRFHQHPSFSTTSATGNYLTFPGQCDVEWYTQSVSSVPSVDNESLPTPGEFIQNAWMPKMASCVIESIETDFTPNNQFSFFKNSGAPTHYTLTLSLKEQLPLTASDIARGF